MGLTRFERRWLLTVVDAILPSGTSARLPVGARDVPMDGYFDDLLRRAPGKVRFGLRVTLWAIWLAPLFVLGKLRTFGGLGEDDRIALLHKLRRSNRYLIREAPILFKTMACLGYGGHPEVQRRVGIDQVDETPPRWARRDP